MATSENFFGKSDDHGFGEMARADTGKTFDNLLYDKLLKLKQSLEARRPADFQSRDFYFDAESLESALLPRSVHQIIQNNTELQALTVACVHATDNDPTATSYEFTFQFSNDEETTNLSILRPHYYELTPDEKDFAVTEEIDTEEDDDDTEDEGGYSGDFASVAVGVQELEPATSEELNQLLASLLYDKAEDGFNTFDYRTKTFTQLIEALSDVSDVTTGKDTYVLTDTDDGYSGELSYFLHGTIPMEFKIIPAVFHNPPDAYNSAFDELDVTTSRYAGEDTELWRHRLGKGAWMANVFGPKSPSTQTLLDFIETQTQDES